MRNSSTIAGFIQCSGRKLEEAEDFNVFSSFIACSNRNAIVILSSLQLNSKQCIITQQFTARADLFFKNDLA